MTNPAPREWRGLVRERGFQVVIAATLCTHALLLAGDLRDPARMLVGDRSTSRLETIEALLRSPDPVATLQQAGAPGDYVFHALLWKAGGGPLVLTTQILLFALSIGVLYRLARRFHLGQAGAAAACLSYLLLPNSLRNTHTLVSEALFNPIVVIGFALFAESLFERTNRVGRAAAFGLLAGLASAIRQLFLATPPVLSLFFFANGRRAWASAIVACSLAVLPSVGWELHQYLRTGTPELGGSDHGLGLNMYLRMERMELVGGTALAPEQRAAHAADPGSFVAYLAANPAAYVRTLRADLVTLALNSGVNSLLGVYLGLFEKSDGARYWSELLDRGGLQATLEELRSRNTWMIASNLLGAALWLVFVAAGGAGLVLLVLGPERAAALALVASGVLLCLFPFLVVSGTVRAGHRSPGEYVLAIGVGASLARLAVLARARGASAPRRPPGPTSAR